MLCLIERFVGGVVELLVAGEIGKFRDAAAEGDGEFPAAAAMRRALQLDQAFFPVGAILDDGL